MYIHRNVKSTIIAIVGVLLFLFAGAGEVSGAAKFAVATGNWTGAIWATTAGGVAGSAPTPIASDAVTINSGVIVTINAAGAVCTTIALTAPTANNGITIASPGTLVASGAITMNSPTSGTITSTIAVGDGSLSAASITIPGSATSGRYCTLSVSTGTATFSGNVTFTGTAAQARLLFTGAGTVNVGGTLSTGGTFTPSTGTVNFNGAAQTVNPYTFYNLILSGSGAKTCTVTSVTNDMTLSGTATVTHGANLTVGRDLNLNGGTFTTGAFTLSVTRNLSLAGGNLTTTGAFATTVTGTTLITSGTLTVPVSAGNKTFTGLITLNGGTMTGASTTLVLGGGITNTSGTVTLTGTATMSTAGAIFSGANTIAIATVTVTSPGTVANSGTVTVATNLGGTGSFTNSGTLNLNGTCSVTTLTNNGSVVSSGGAITSTTVTNNLNFDLNGTGAVTAFTNTATGVLTISATPTVPTFTTLTTSAAGNTVNYDGAGAQTIKGNTYYNLILSGSGLKTINSITIGSGGALTTNNLALSFVGDFVNNSTLLNAGSSDISISGAATTQSIDGFTTTGTVSMTKTAGTATLQGNVNGGALTINGAGGTLNLGGGTHIFTGAWTRTNGTLDGGSSLLKIGGSVSGTGGTFTPSTGTVEWNALGAQTVAGVTYNNLTLSGSGAKTTTGVTVNGILSMEGNGTVSSSAVISYGAAATLQYKGSAAQTTTNNEFPVTFSGTGGLIINNASGVTLNNAKSISSLDLLLGILNTGGNVLSVTNTSTTSIYGGSATTFIVGPVKWTLPASLVSGSTYFFPVGAGTTYLPFSLVNPTTGLTTTPTAQVQAFATGSGGSAGTGVTAISSSEYWQLTTAGSFTNSSVSIARPTAITPSTVVATNTTSAGSAYLNLGGTYDTYGVYNSNPTSTVGAQYFVFGTGNAASLNISTNVLYGFNYPLGYGPSAEQSFKVSGIVLTDTVVVTPASSNFEISTVSGGIFQTTAIKIPKDGSNKVSATIYVRLKSAQALGNYTSSITVSSTGRTTQTVNLYGSVSPTITASGGGSYCTGSTINLSSTGGTNWYWTGPSSYYSLLQSPSITSATTAMTGTYTVSGNTPSGTNLVVNGNFESGNSNITTDYFYAGTGSTALSSGGTHGNTGGEGNYTVVQNPNTVHSSFSNCSPNGGTMQMVINGSSYVETVWGQTITGITPYSNYQFVYYVQTVCATFPSQLQLYVNGVAAGPIYSADPIVCVQKQFIYNWNSGSSTTAILQLKNQQTAVGGNDFAIDDISFEQVYTSTASVNVTVLAASAPASVSVSASANPVNAGTSVTYTATPTNGGTSPTYQWSVNGVDVSGATSTTYSYIPANGDIVKCKMTSSSSCLTGSNPVYSSVTMIVNPAVKNYWVGTNSTDWGTASNWSAGYVPGDNDEVEFAATANSYGSNAKRNLVLDIDRRVSRLTNQSSLPIRQLIIPAARGLTVSDTIKIPATYPDSSRIYIQTDATGSQQNGTLIFHNKGKVYAFVEMYARGSYNATGATYSTVTYHYTWQYFGIPVATATANPTFYGSYVRSWYEPGTNMTNHWKYLTNDSILKPFWGYELTQTTPKVIVFNGQLLNSDWTSTILATSSGVPFPGQYIFANPYTAAINMQDFITTNLPYDTDGSVYLYSTGSYANWGNNGTGSTDGTSPGQYQVCTMAGGGATQISSMQALLMQTTTSLLPTTKVVFHYSDVEKNNILQRAKGTVNKQPSSLMTNIKIDVNGAHFNDKMWLFSDSTFTSSYDKGWDGRKLFGIAFAPQIFAIEEDGPYQISCKKSINNTIIGFQRGLDTEYTLTFTNSNTDKDYKSIYLLDSVANKIIDITNSGTQYSFSVDSIGTYNNRFKIITSKVETNPSQNNKLTIFNASGKFYVDNKSNEIGEFSLFDLAGRTVRSNTFAANSVTEVGSVKQNGIYIGRASISAEKKTERFMLNKQ